MFEHLEIFLMKTTVQFCASSKILSYSGFQINGDNGLNLQNTKIHQLCLKVLMENGLTFYGKTFFYTAFSSPGELLNMTTYLLY